MASNDCTPSPFNTEHNVNICFVDFSFECEAITLISLRKLCQAYLKIDDELVELYHKIEENTGKPEYHVFISEYLAKYMEREDLKSGMRRYLINELINGVEE